MFVGFSFVLCSFFVRSSIVLRSCFIHSHSFSLIHSFILIHSSSIMIHYPFDLHSFPVRSSCPSSSNTSQQEPYDAVPAQHRRSHNSRSGDSPILPSLLSRQAATLRKPCLTHLRTTMRHLPDSVLPESNLISS